MSAATKEQEVLAFERPEVMADRATHYCPGCHHGVAHRLVAELLTEMELVEKTICVTSIGCSVFLYNYLLVDSVEAPHGRAPAVATGVKRARPDNFVLTYQGDGDLASIGMAEIMHAAARGENITVIFINNAIYGMTGGQMAPTTLPGQKTTSSPHGRDVEAAGFPIRMAEALATLDGAGYVVRRSLHNPKNIRLAKKAIRMGFEAQVRGLGFSLIELLSTCPTNWGVPPMEALKWLEEHMVPVYPLDDFKVSPALAGVRA